MIRFVVALAPEAEPLVRRYRMAPVEGSFRCYLSERAALAVSGVGKLAAAAATSYLHAKTGEERLGVWLNLGIAGHRSRRPGTALLAHTVTDVASGERWHPGRLAGSLEAAEVRTVDRLETELGPDAAYDMEASGFYPTALRFSICELVQAVKIVSDDGESSARGLTRAIVRDLVESRIDQVEELASELRELAGRLEPLRCDPQLGSLVDAYRRNWHFTATETHRLRRLLSRLGALAPAERELPAAATASSSAEEVLRILEARVSALAMERPI